MKTRKFLTTMLSFGLVLLTLASCKKDGPQSIYLPMSGVYPVTFETGKLSGGIKIQSASRFYLCSNSFPFLSLSGGTVTIVPKSEKMMQFASGGDSASFSAIITTVAWENGSEVMRGTEACVDSLRRLNFKCPPECILGQGSYLSVTYPVPKEYGDYDFLLRFEYPAKGLYFESPVYRFTITQDTSNDEWFRTSIVEL